MSRSTKKDYPKKFDSRRFDWSCRNHGSCDYCRRNRLHFDRKARAKSNLTEQLQEMQVVENQRVTQIGPP